MALMKVRLELGRTPDYPEGNSLQGYELVLPLDENGYICPAEWRKYKDLCTVRRFGGGFTNRRGLIRHVGQGWQLDYDPRTDADNEPVLKLDKHVVASDNYISLSGSDGKIRPFKVVSVTPVSGEGIEASGS